MAAFQTCPSAQSHQTFLWEPAVTIWDVRAPFSAECHCAAISGSVVDRSLNPARTFFRHSRDNRSSAWFASPLRPHIHAPGGRATRPAVCRKAQPGTAAEVHFLWDAIPELPPETERPYHFLPAESPARHRPDSQSRPGCGTERKHTTHVLFHTSTRLCAWYQRLPPGASAYRFS